MNSVFWNERFAQDNYVYGETPNEFLEKKLHDFKPGKILFPCEGEGRNSVFAASLGWDVYAFDQSVEGKKKAEKLAEKKNVKINYSICEVEEADYPKESFDAIVLIFAHFPEPIRRRLHRKLSAYLKKGGHLIIEGFEKKHSDNQKTNPKAGGPRDEGMLYNLEDLKEDFEGFEFIESDYAEEILKEGEFHVGKSNLARLVAVKK